MSVPFVPAPLRLLDRASGGGGIARLRTLDRRGARVRDSTAATPSCAPGPSPATKRVDSIDVTRGLLMCLIVVTHAGGGLDAGTLAARALGVLTLPLLCLATPGFTLVSGLMLGYFLVARDDHARILGRYRRRGWTLLLVTHPLVALALYLPMRSGEDVPFASFLFARWYITDALALIFVFLAPVVPRLGPAARVATGAVLLALSRLVHWGVSPQWPPLVALKEALTGVATKQPAARFFDDTYAVLPLAGMFLVGSAIGHRYGHAVREDRRPEFVASLLRRLPALLALSGLLVGGWWVLRTGLLGVTSPFWRRVLYPDRELSLFPFHLALFVALFAFFVHRVDAGRGKGRAAGVLRLLGQTSLFTYTVHYFVVQTAPYLLGRWHRMTGWEWMALCGLALPLLSLAASRWKGRGRRPS